MNYRQTLDYIFSKLPMFSRIGSTAIKNGLQNIEALCSVLGNPHTKCKYVHVAGTNGKGSVSHMLASVLQTSGYKTGLYTSPHLRDLRERIKINGKEISEQEVVAFISNMLSQIEVIQPSFFEITVAMAFEHFASHDCDIAVIETGLGGRLDSTNIIIPEISVITNIGYDHKHILGDTLAAIAIEKAGIIKKQVPVIIGESHRETSPVFEQVAKEKEAPIYFADRVLELYAWHYDTNELAVELAAPHKADHRKYQLDLTGVYQTKNILTTLATLQVLQTTGWQITEKHIRQGLQHTRKYTGLHGRWETIGHNPRVVIDVAHNPDGIEQLLHQLEITTYRHLHMILGMVKDKDVEAVLAMLPSAATYYFTHAHVPRALNAAELQRKAAVYGLEGQSYSNVNEAITSAKKYSHSEDLILICGSVFLIGEVIY